MPLSHNPIQHHTLSSLQPYYIVLGIYFSFFKTLIRARNVFTDVYCPCLHFVLSIRRNSQQQIKDRLDAKVSKDSENAAVSFTARKNKTHSMTNMLVIHSQSIAGFDSMEFSTWQIFAKFISLEYLLKSVCWISVVTKGPEYSSYSQWMSLSYWSSLYDFWRFGSGQNKKGDNFSLFCNLRKVRWINFFFPHVLNHVISWTC